MSARVPTADVVAGDRVVWSAHAADAAVPLNRLHVRVGADGGVAERREAWLVAVPVGIAGWLRETFETADSGGADASVVRAAVVLELQAGQARDPLTAAGVAACRGLVLSVAEEIGRRGRANLVVSGEAAEAEVRDTIAYLASPEAAFTTAATLTLEGAR